MASIVVTLDVGGSGVKVSAFDVDSRVSVGSVVGRYSTPAAPAEEGTFDPESWWGTAIETGRLLVENVGRPPMDYLAVTVSAIRGPFVMLDRNGDALGPCLLNRDPRADPQVRRIVKSLGEAGLYEATGHWGSTKFGLPRMLWVRDNHPRTWAAATTILQLHDWFIYKLSGIVASEPSSAAMSQCLAVSGGDWNGDLLHELNIALGLFPELSPAGTGVGGLLPRVASAAGLPVGLPVHLGGGDTHFSATAAGGLCERVPVVVAGSTGPTQLVVDSAPDSGSMSSLYPLLISRLVQPTGWALETNTGPLGDVTSWTGALVGTSGDQLRSALFQRGLQLVEPSIGQPEELMVLAGNPFFGPGGWHRWPAPTVVGLRADHTGVDVLRQGLRGTCLAVTSVLELFWQCGRTTGDTILATGGMSTNIAWCQGLADVAGRRVRVRPLHRLAGLAGAAVVAGPEVLTSLLDIQATSFEPAEVEYAERTEELARYRLNYAAAQAVTGRRDKTRGR